MLEDEQPMLTEPLKLCLLSKPSLFSSNPNPVKQTRALERTRMRSSCAHLHNHLKQLIIISGDLEECATMLFMSVIEPHTGISV